MAIKASDKVTLVRVNDGAAGAKGTGVSNIVEEYYLSTSSTTQSGGSWSTTSPTWKSGYYIWTRSHVTWDNGTTTYTTPVLAKALNTASTTAAEAKTTAETASTTASEAKTTAETASTTASEAKTTAAAAKATAETALSTATKTSNYFFYDSDGAHVATTDGKADEGSNVLIDSDSLDIRNGTKVLSTFGAYGATIGASGDQRVELAAGSMKVLDRGDYPVFEIVDERDATTGLSTVKETFQAAGQDIETFYVSLPSKNDKIVSVLLGSTETTDYTEYSSTFDGHYLYGVQILATVLQAANATTVTITYTTDAADWHLTIGSRDGDAGPLSTVIGSLSSATSIGSYAEGYQAKASGKWSHAEGYGATASDFYSHAEGSISLASGYCSHAEGRATTASGSCSHAEGIGTTASGSCSHAEGIGTTASGNCSHAEGNGSLASGYCSHAEGLGTTASGDYSHASGNGTIASSDNQFVIGAYNKEDTDAIFIIGNGVPGTRRSNILTVTSSAMSLNGDMFVNGGTWSKSLELKNSIPYIDFHYGNSTADYTHRIIATSASGLSIYSGSVSFSNSGKSITVNPGSQTITFNDGKSACKSDGRLYFYWSGSHVMCTIDGTVTQELAYNG